MVGTFGPRHIEPGVWAAQQVIFETYDVASPAEPNLMHRLEVEGGLVSSRRLGDQVIIASRHMPQIDGLIPYLFYRGGGFTKTNASSQTPQRRTYSPVSASTVIVSTRSRLTIATGRIRNIPWPRPCPVIR